MKFLITYWKSIAAGGLALICGIILGYNVGYYFGKKDGIALESASNAISGAKENTKASSQREHNETTSRSLTHTDLDNRLRDAGWLRSDQ